MLAFLTPADVRRSFMMPGTVRRAILKRFSATRRRNAKLAATDY
jgi:hypothetical protein